MLLEIENDVLKSYAYKTGSLDMTVAVPNHVRVIGKRAFENQRILSKVILPEKLEKIEWSAFQGCRYLEAIRIPPGVHTIENFAFSDCEHLTSFMIPDTIRSCGKHVLEGCGHLNRITIYRQDGRMFHFPVHSQYASTALKLLLHLPDHEEQRIPPDRFCFLLYRMLDSGYDETNDTAGYLFLSAVSQCIGKNDAEALASLKTLLEDAPKMQKVHPQCFEDMIVYANEHQNYDVQLLLMDAAKRYCSGSSEEHFQL